MHSPRKFRATSICSQPKKDTPILLIIRYLSLLQGLLSYALLWIFKNTKDDFSTTHSPCWQRRKLLDCGYSSVQSGTIVPPNPMGMGKCRCHHYAPLSLGYSHSSFTETGHISVPLPLYEKNYLAFVSVRQGMT